jgi:hypothetical protein
VADVPEPGVCEACGRPLPSQQGKGRRRKYCDARCRDAARRQRGRPTRPTRQDQETVKESLTEANRQEYVYNVDGSGSPSAEDPVTVRVKAAADHLLEAFTHARRPGDGVAAAQELADAANAALQAAIDRARAAGSSWRDIGEVLGTSRQAAFQRFGRPVDPRTGEPMSREVLPGALERAVTIFGWYREGRWAEILAELDENMRRVLDSGRLADGSARMAAMFGGLERFGEPFAFPAGDDTMVEVPLHFEAGDARGLVRFSGDGKVAGLAIRPPST